MGIFHYDFSGVPTTKHRLWKVPTFSTPGSAVVFLSHISVACHPPHRELPKYNASDPLIAVWNLNVHIWYICVFLVKFIQCPVHPLGKHYETTVESYCSTRTKVGYTRKMSRVLQLFSWGKSRNIMQTWAIFIDILALIVFPIWTCGILNYSTKETHIWLPWHIISILGIATHITWYQTVPRSIWNRMMITINVSRNYPRYQSRTSTGGVYCQKWQFLYFYGHHQKQFLCTHDITGIQDQYHWTMKCFFPLRKSLMRNMWHRTRWFTMTLVSTDQGTTRVVG